jgi:hypothetical protein
MKKSIHQKLYINGKIAGEIVGDTLRIVKRDKSHYVRKYQGYGISPETFAEAEAAGCKYLLLVAPDGETFRLKIRDFIASATPDSLGGFGRQLFLSVKWLRWYSTHAPSYRNEPQPIQQMSLFGQ